MCEEEVEFVRLEVTKVLYVANMCDQAVPVSAEDFKAATADPLCEVGYLQYSICSTHPSQYQSVLLKRDTTEPASGTINLRVTRSNKW